MPIAHIKTPIGVIILSFDDNFNLIKITKSDDREFLDGGEYPESIKILVDFLNAYFSGKPLRINYPLKLDNISEFDKKVLNLISSIPFGQTVSYKWVAEKLKTSPRAVGQALKRNPFPLLIPCHRIIKSDGNLGGYSLGLDVKKWLLEYEKSILYKLPSRKT